MARARKPAMAWYFFDDRLNREKIPCHRIITPRVELEMTVAGSIEPFGTAMRTLSGSPHE